MKTKPSPSLSFIFVIIVTITTIVGITSFSLHQSTFAQNSKFIANLLSSNEVPPGHSKAAGMAEFTTMDNSIKYTIVINAINGVMAGHIHLGKAGQNGDIIATLFDFKSPQSKVIEKGVLTSSSLLGPLKGKQVSDLISAMKNGNTYVNVHTKNNPNGEIRGQIVATK